MNFRTTIILIVLLVVVGALLFFTRETATAPTEQAIAKLINLTPGDVVRISISSERTTIRLQKGDAGWRLVEPVTAPADAEAVELLVQALASLSSKTQVDPANTGVDQPRYVVELSTGNGSTNKLEVGDRSAAGDNLYVRLDGRQQAQVVGAELEDLLARPVKALRRDQLFDLATMQIQQLRIESPKSNLTLKRVNGKWELADGPTTMPAEQSEATDVAMTLASLRASDFVTESTTEAASSRFGFDAPSLDVSFSTQPPTTQPATSQSSMSRITFGEYSDVLKRDVFARCSEMPGVVKIAASSMDRLNKTALDLRDRAVLKVDPQHVNRISIKSNDKTTVLARAPVPATTQATTEPTTVPSKWQVMSVEPNVDADDRRVDTMLRELAPLRADKYLQTNPTTQPAARIEVTLESDDSRTDTIAFIDPGDGRTLIGEYNGLVFELPRFLLEQLQRDYAVGKANDE